jgi:hypothetical protein
MDEVIDQRLNGWQRLSIRNEAQSALDVTVSLTQTGRKTAVRRNDNLLFRKMLRPW